MIGSTILHYKILEKLGEGGMGIVYLAEDTKLGRKVALKFLPQHISADSEIKARFAIEARAAAALNHPNIATIHNIEETDKEMFIVMEYIKGVELKDKISSAPEGMEKNEIIKIATQIADGLEVAHKEGITHRDIKSGNIMITESGIVKIMDFGLAKVKGGSKVTQMGSTVGTIAYMSPEQTRGDEVDSRADIWSLGVVIYEMLTGKIPFRGDYNQAIIYSILNEEPQPLSKTEEGLEHIISKALKKDPEERYQSAGEIAEELRTISQGGEVKRVKAKGSKLPWIVAGAAVIVIAIALYLFMPTSKGGEETTATEVKTIAILPFDDLSPKKDQGYFSDGLSEELINVLSRNKKLRVTAKTSSFSFRGTNTDIKTIAEKLNVKNILEGSVRKAGNNLRISADLVNVETAATLWSNTFYGKMDNIFALQDSISNKVAEVLNVALLGKESVKPAQKTDPEAYNYYLQAEHFNNQFNKESWEKAIQYYNKALKIDSSYAPAWTGLAYVHMYQAGNGYLTIADGISKAHLEIEKALSYDSDFAKAYDAKGSLLRNFYWDWDAANKSNRHALELDPENADLMVGAAQSAATVGKFEDALKLLHHSIELDPVNAMSYYSLGFNSYRFNLMNDALTAFKKTLELNPQFQVVHTYIGLVYLDLSKRDSALAEVLKVEEPFWRKYGLTLVYNSLGNEKKAGDLLNQLIEEYESNAACQIAEIYSCREQPDSAFYWLDRAYKQRDPGLADILGDPLLRNIIKDPRYTAFLKKMNLPL